MKQRPLNKYFTTGSLDTIKSKNIDLSPLNKIKKEINKTIELKNEFIELYIKKIKSNCSKHSDFKMKIKLEEIESKLKQLQIYKKNLILKILTMIK
tara:strand:- start:1178 stop:1465 length:288 start_codon:yes stop_codon:yes gene_type:complete